MAAKYNNLLIFSGWANRGLTFLVEEATVSYFGHWLGTYDIQHHHNKMSIKQKQLVITPWITFKMYSLDIFINGRSQYWLQKLFGVDW